MPTPLAHSFCGFLFYPETQKYVFKNKVYAGSFIVFFSCLPDFDYFMGMFAGDLKAGHRLLTHSLFFPLIIGIVSGTVAKLMKKIFLSFFILTTSLMTTHILLDYLSFDNYPQNGIGIALFWPFLKNFFIFPFHPIAGWFSEGPHGLFFILINDLYFMVVFVGLFFGLEVHRNRRKEKKCASA
jgi:membrane-bound metal-dependent hydrolase YbcI (DUF457 family)